MTVAPISSDACLCARVDSSSSDDEQDMTPLINFMIDKDKATVRTYNLAGCYCYYSHRPLLLQSPSTKC